MKPEQEKLLMDMVTLSRETSRRLDAFLDVYYRTNLIDQMIQQNKSFFTNDVEIDGNLTLKSGFMLKEGTTLPLGSTTGVTFGSTGDKIAFLGHAPIIRQPAITKPTAPSAAYVQAEATSMKTAVDALIDFAKNFGFTA